MLNELFITQSNFIKMDSPCVIFEFKCMKFIQSAIPNDFELAEHIKNLQILNTRRMVRVCESDFSRQRFANCGILIDELIFMNGTFPPPSIVNQWINIIQHNYFVYANSSIAVQCASGLGRSAVLIAIALMEAGMAPEDVINLVRNKRRGAFNVLQYNLIMNYKSQNRLIHIEIQQAFDFCSSLTSSVASDTSD